MQAPRAAPLASAVLLLLGLGVAGGHLPVGAAARGPGQLQLHAAVPVPAPASGVPDLHARKRPMKSLIPRLVAEMKTLRECRDVPSNAIKYYKMTSVFHGRVGYVINGNFNVSRQAERITEVSLVLTKCREMVSSNTCEHFHTWRFNNKNVCTMMLNGNEIWSHFGKNVQPKLTCPTAPGTHRIVNASIDVNVVRALPMPLEGHVYLVRHFMIQPDGLPHICSDAEVKFHRVRD